MGSHPLTLAVAIRVGYGRVLTGLYMHGTVGCGKTFVMDLLFDAVPITRKRRVHFHDFMLSVHQR